MAFIKQFGLHWPRNQENLDELEDLAATNRGFTFCITAQCRCISAAAQSVRGCAAMARKDPGKNNSGIGFRGS
jgi:hypothetical protein